MTYQQGRPSLNGNHRLIDKKRDQLVFFLWNAQFEVKREIFVVLLFIFKLEVDCFGDKQEKVFLPSAVSFWSHVFFML